MGSGSIQLVSDGPKSVFELLLHGAVFAGKAPQVFSRAAELHSHKLKPRIYVPLLELAAIDQDLDQRCCKRGQKAAVLIIRAWLKRVPGKPFADPFNDLVWLGRPSLRQVSDVWRVPTIVDRLCPTRNLDCQHDGLAFVREFDYGCDGGADIAGAYTLDPPTQAITSFGSVNFVESCERPVVRNADKDGTGIRGSECRDFLAEFVTVCGIALHELKMLSFPPVP